MNGTMKNVVAALCVMVVLVIVATSCNGAFGGAAL